MVATGRKQQSRHELRPILSPFVSFEKAPCGEQPLLPRGSDTVVTWYCFSTLPDRVLSVFPPLPPSGAVELHVGCAARVFTPQGGDEEDGPRADVSYLPQAR